MTATASTDVHPVADPRPALDGGDAPQGEAPLVEEESLVEEISIDGMCGVY